VANYIGLISQGRFDEAYVLSRHQQCRARRARPHCARPCEPVCRRNQDDGAVSTAGSRRPPMTIASIDTCRCAADHQDQEGRIIGAGSAGIACAADLAERADP